MSFLAILGPAWVPSEFNYRWSLPSDPLSDEGLGGGIGADGAGGLGWGGGGEGEGPMYGPTMVCSL